jgi:hypothetical protein
MNANNCGKGLAVFSVTLVLGIGIASLFISNAEITEIPQPQITKKEVSVKPKETKICVKEYEKLDKYTEKEIELAPLVQELAEIESRLLKNNKAPETDIKSLLKRKAEIYKHLFPNNIEQPRPFNENENATNKNLLYTENCYENEF